MIEIQEGQVWEDKDIRRGEVDGRKRTIHLYKVCKPIRTATYFNRYGNPTDISFNRLRARFTLVGPTGV